MQLTISVEELRISHVDWWNIGEHISGFSLFYFCSTIFCICAMHDPSIFTETHEKANKVQKLVHVYFVKCMCIIVYYS